MYIHYFSLYQLTSAIFYFLESALTWSNRVCSIDNFAYQLVDEIPQPNSPEYDHFTFLM